MSENKKQNYETPELADLEVNGFVVMAQDGQASNQYIESGEDEENV